MNNLEYCKNLGISMALGLFLDNFDFKIIEIPYNMKRFYEISSHDGEFKEFIDIYDKNENNEQILEQLLQKVADEQMPEMDLDMSQDDTKMYFLAHVINNIKKFAFKNFDQYIKMSDVKNIEKIQAHKNLKVLANKRQVLEDLYNTSQNNNYELATISYMKFIDHLIFGNTSSPKNILYSPLQQPLSFESFQSELSSFENYIKILTDECDYYNQNNTNQEQDKIDQNSNNENDDDFDDDIGQEK